MYREKKVVVVMPAYHAEATLLKTHREVLEQDYVDLIIVVDDDSKDRTAELARSLPKTKLFVHESNLGYGGNQKTCYRQALLEGADIIIMVHPDYQYTPRLIPAFVSLVGSGLYHFVLGSRILGGYALKGGMPLYKYVSNRALTFAENLLTGAKLSEYHTGYRAFSRDLLTKVPFEKNSNDFVFDNQIIAQILWLGYTVAEVSCPTNYFPAASSINFSRSTRYGIGCLVTALTYRLAKMGLMRTRLFPVEANR
ncbi:MAG TPA: glycosyltransferase family 2 protein [Syntrophorhabdales bacterium]|nr:glycosyltransferase family 2 protein [Syntrophorhabdales bacterium]